MAEYYSIRWVDGVVSMLDQRMLPQQIQYKSYSESSDVAIAIRDMVIRGAPAIGIAGGYGLALAAIYCTEIDAKKFRLEMAHAADLLRQSRPTAVNLSWAIDRVMKKVYETTWSDVNLIKKSILDEAHKIAEEDAQINYRIAMNGLGLVPDRANIIHHCNTGALATGGYGTALGVIRAAHEHGKEIHVFVDETRPRLQGSRLTAWELQQLGIPHTIIVDGASGYIMRQKKIDVCFVGCDRIATNGDTANKIGTYNLALVARAHHVPFYVVGPVSTIDPSISNGEEIPIEERAAEEITEIEKHRISPEDVRVANPAFDITPAKYITGIVTEKGIATPPYNKSLRNFLE